MLASRDFPRLTRRGYRKKELPERLVVDPTHTIDFSPLPMSYRWLQTKQAHLGDQVFQVDCFAVLFGQKVHQARRDTREEHPVQNDMKLKSNCYPFSPFRSCPAPAAAATAALKLACQAVRLGLLPAVERGPAPSHLVSSRLFLLKVLFQGLQIHLVEVDDAGFASGCRAEMRGTERKWRKPRSGDETRGEDVRWSGPELYTPRSRFFCTLVQSILSSDSTRTKKA